MKITKTTTTEFEFTFEVEEKRLRKNFKGDQLQRQLSILNHFKNGDYSAMSEAYDALPYDEDEECSEKEYIGLWCSILFGGWNEYTQTKGFKITFKRETLNNGTSDRHVILYCNDENT